MLMSPHCDEIMDRSSKRGSCITTGAGNPGKYIPKLKEAGCKVIPVVASVAGPKAGPAGCRCRWLEGTEAGGISVR